MQSVYACLAFSLLLTGCAAEGLIVNKSSQPRPDSSMTGSEGVHSFVFRGPTGRSRPPIGVGNPHFWNDKNGSYKFALRDRQNEVRSQLVTPGVYGEYETGDYFNDRLPPEEAVEAKDARAKCR